MEFVTDPKQIKRYLASLTACLRRAGERIGPGREKDFLWNDRLGFWARQGATPARFQLTLGFEDPRVFVRPKSVCRVDVAWSQPPAGASGALVQYGADVVLAARGVQTGEFAEFSRFLALHDYDLVQANLGRPGGKKRDLLLLTSVHDDNAPQNLFKFVRCLYEFRAWRDSGLIASLPGGSAGLCEGRHPPLVNMVLAALDEQLAKRIPAGWRQSRPSACSLSLEDGSGPPQALFEILPDIAPQSLFAGSGRLLLSRQGGSLGKCLVLPAKVGSFFTQAMHRQGIQVVTYALGKSGVVFFDLDEALADMT